MSYITQIIVPYDLAIHKMRIRDSYDWHQMAWKAFSDQGLQEREFLTRLDEKEEGYRLLIVSTVAPQKPDWCPTDCFQCKPIPDGFLKHKDYRFNLLANPTKKVIDPQKQQVATPEGKILRNKNSKRIPLVCREDLVQWIQRKGENGGFEVDPETLKTIPHRREYFSKKGHRGVHSAIEFQGTLRVTDSQKFHDTFYKGIGSAKAFGFGLLLLIPFTNN